MSVRAAPARKPPTLAVKLAVCLRMLGLKGKKVDWSHEPALGLRAINEGGTDYDPPQHDPDYLFAREAADHDKLTFKDNGTGRSDLSAIAHVKRTAQKQDTHRQAMAAKASGEPALRPRAKRKIQSRGFDKRHRPLRSRSDLQRRNP